jgi:hypothetical protein
VLQICALFGSACAGLAEVGGGLLDLVQRKVADRAARQWFGPLRRQASRRGEIVDRELMLLFSLIEQAAIVQGLGVTGIERDRLVELGECLFGLCGSRQRLASRGIGLRRRPCSSRLEPPYWAPATAIPD